MAALRPGSNFFPPGSIFCRCLIPAREALAAGQALRGGMAGKQAAYFAQFTFALCTWAELLPTWMTNSPGSQS